MIYQKLAESGVDYKPGDFKAEIHFLGQIVGASNIMEKDAIKIIGDTNQKSENLSNLIKAKQTQLNEGHYLLKTLRGTLSKLKKDSFILQPSR